MARWGDLRGVVKGLGPKPRALKVRLCVNCNQERPFRGRRCMVCRVTLPSVSKYGNVPVKGEDGKWIHSTGEARRKSDLQWLESQGKVRGLRFQVPYSLDVKAQDGTLVHVTNYKSDFEYFDLELDRLIVEDFKSDGTRTPEYRIKKVLMLACHSITILETTKADLSSIGSRRSA